MNNQELQYTIGLTIGEVDDVMAALADRANHLSSLQKKIFNQAVQQKQSFENFMSNNSVQENVVTEETPVEDVEISNDMPLDVEEEDVF